MSKINCPCGNQLSDVSVPSINRAWLLTDEQFENSDDLIDIAILQTQLQAVWVCNECDRRGLEDKTGRVEWYARETVK